MGEVMAKNVQMTNKFSFHVHSFNKLFYSCSFINVLNEHKRMNINKCKKTIHIYMYYSKSYDNYKHKGTNNTNVHVRLTKPKNNFIHVHSFIK